MAHAFTLLLLVDHEFLPKLTQDLNQRIFPVRRSKLSRSLITTENQSVERSVIERLPKVKDIVTIYDICMSHNTDKFFSLMTHYCNSPDRNNTHIGMPYTTATNGVYLSKSVMEVVNNFGLEAKTVGITSDCDGNIWVCREALESKYSNDSVFHHPRPSSP